MQIRLPIRRAHMALIWHSRKILEISPEIKDLFPPSVRCRYRDWSTDEAPISESVALLTERMEAFGEDDKITKSG